MPRRRLSLSISAAAALTLGAGLGVTALLFSAVSRLEYDKMALSFQQRATLRATALHKGLDDAVEVLTVTNQLFATVEAVSREQFRVFTAPLLARYPFIQAFNFHRVLAHAERAAFEAALRREHPGYAMTEMRDGKLVPAQRRASYLVVDYLEPMRGNEAALGMDVAPNRFSLAALEQSLLRGRASATALLTLAQETTRQRGFVIVAPVYRLGAPTATLAERRAALVGDTAAVVRATSLVHKVMQGADLLSDPQIELSVYASAAADPAQLIYRSGAPDAAHAPAAPLPRWLLFDYRDSREHSFNAAGRPWHVRVQARPRPFLADHVGSLSTLLGGILFTLLTTAFVQTLAQRSRRVQRLVDERTVDLKLSNERLSADVRARKRTERALQESEKRFRRLLALSSDWYWEQDAQFRFTNITSGFADKSQMPLERFIGLTRWDNNAEMRESEWGQAHIAAVKAHQPFADLEYPMADRHGQMRWFSINGEPLFDDKGNFEGYRGTGAEITERKLSEQRIHHIAHHDVLTGLPNRALLRERLGQAIAAVDQGGEPLWVLLIDLDRFKFINDSLGHKAGDLLLKTVAARLKAGLRESDTVARLSGDEFVAILGQRPEQALAGEVVQRLMDQVAQPVTLEGKEVFVSCSIGVAVYPGAGGGQQNLIEQADIAMYCAKKQGRNNFQFYAPQMNEAAQERMRIEGALRSALERDEFVLHYQPQLDLKSGLIVGVEALLRWQHPELGVVAPSRFIALAEETGLIVPIGAWVMRTACAQNQAWRQAGLGQLRIAVNLSARQFSEANLVASIAAVLAETGLAPACLELELTESLFMHDIGVAVDQLHAMKALGVQLSIDDFGTGYSSFSYLRRFPIDVLKIDRTFVNDIANDADDAAIVDSIIALAHNLKLRVIAEGVETEAQLDYLRQHGCDEMQGYYFSRPLPPEQFEQMLRQGLRLAPAPALPQPRLVTR
ncbi:MULTISPECIES: bifunctional diguanylate cyclase/phosphodiesterase [unclassified Janthinobacterium]|uniref:bifunctional diguanylate cyclase/phosphodiesterase n=1 Tax=unclassified Janthinobacterium TaxID=2610881 RepID=UPI00034A0D03|nr:MULTISPECIES: EAL domain-containing protein [unclassified Janthinobacterium]MEC5160430.1 diguanylate cyclase (GGDEF)-like protein/PAS domain S-box-containing protein [Janthinobacterium sp. CG_S6]